MLHTNFSSFPNLSTERLTLRRMTDDDTDDLFLLRSDSRVMAYIDRPMVQAPSDAVKLIRVVDDLLKTGDGITWGIALKERKQLIGTIGLWRIVKEHRRAEIGYLLHPGRQQQGIMHEALAKVLDYGFSVIGLHSVEAVVNPDNGPSIRLLEKNGFVREAYFKENYFFNGLFKDSAVYSLLTPVR